MSQQIRLAFGGAYDRVAELSAVAAGSGLAVENVILPNPADAFAAVSHDEGYDGGEMSISFYMTRRSRLLEECDLVALPVWVSRAFRHGNIYVREDSGLEDPRQLVGRRIGLPEYGMTMAVWLRGVFADDFGVRPGDIEWVTNRKPVTSAADKTPHAANVSIVDRPAEIPWPEQLRNGSIDAWIGAGQAPRPDGVRRLFVDAADRERDYYRRTRVFPIMHVLVLRRALAERSPEVVRALCEAMEETKNRAHARLWSTSVSYPTLPWTLAAVEEQSAVMGGDVWPYGIERNRPTLEALLRYMTEQELLWNRLGLADFFLPFEPA
jgi:4,5-dihydroxyphthalate decarboxylase